MVNKFHLKALSWDSNFFSQKIAQLSFDDTSKCMSSLNDFDLVQTKTATNNYSEINKLNQLGFHLAEGEIDFIIAIKKTVLTSSPDKITIATAQDIEQIREIANGSFLMSRYRKPWFNADKRDEFYQIWAEKAVKGTFDDLCLIIKTANIVTGFITLKIEGKSARIGLIAVNKSYKGQGIGSNLLKHAQYYCQEKNITQLFVATQLANNIAVSLYSKFGFSPNSLSYWFYKTHDPI
ncbi:MAG: dTDP-4-amino-4,6-dideoxy-D-galactose acyltransferase [Alteromonadaceae bacterium]|jgi:dTDP-4-amino-4,6-dideoxy-D-galactose acyltransferase